MKKTLSRLLAAALVLAMVCAMIPAAMATSETNVSIGEGDIAMTVGQSVNMTVTYTPGDSGNKTVVWKAYTASTDGSEVTDIVAFSPNNAETTTVSALKIGTVYIQASVGGVASARRKVDVKCCTLAGCNCATHAAGTACTCTACTAVQSITASKTALPLTAGASETVAFTANYATCSQKNAEAITAEMLNFATDNLAVATVDATGEIKAVADGTARITASLKANSNVYATVDVTVSSIVVSGITAASNKTYKKGETASALTVTAAGGNGTYGYQWYKASNETDAGTAIADATKDTYLPSTAAVDDSHYYCRVTSDGVSVNSARAHIQVVEPTYTLTLTKSTSISLTAGETASVYATVKDASGNTVSSKKVNFSSSNSTYATVTSSSTTNSSGVATATVSALKKGTVTITAAVDGYTSATASVSFTVASDYTANDINYGSNSDGYVYFDEDDFYGVVKSASGKTTLDYVKFTSQYGGKLYKDDTISSSNVVATSTECVYDHSKIYSGQADLDELVFVVNDSKTSHYVEYTAYTSGGTVLATGKVVIDGDGSSDGDVTYYVSYEDTVALDEDDFQNFFEDEYTDGDLEYVRFTIGDATNYGSTSYGYLYESDAAKASKVSSSTKFYFDASSTQDDLDNVVFTAGTKTTAYTVKIPFTATGKDKNKKSRSVDGTLVIEVNGGTSVTITTDGATFDNLKLVKALTPKNVTSSKLDSYFVKFTKVTGGTLYTYYKTATNSEEWVKRDEFYFNAGEDQYDLGDVFFLPKSTVNTAEISYTIYRESGKSEIEVDSGKITFKVEQAKVTVTFTDIPANVKTWAGDAIEYMAKEGYVGGTGSKTFSPNASMSRAMLVTVLYRMAGEPSVTGIANPFKDVVKGTYYYNAVLWAYNKGIVTGKSADKFAPNDNVSRQEIATFIYRYAGKPAATGTLTGFSDYNKVSSYATNAVKWATRNEIITGIGGKLVPGAAATRAQVVAMLYRYLNA